MPYAPAHKAETRARILDSARRLFNRNGLTAVSIDEVMAGAGLTRGGFYSHFNNKEELYAEAILHFTHCDPVPGWQQPAFAAVANGQTLARAVMSAYLSREHAEDIDGSCPMIGLATDVARSGGAAKAAYRQILGMMADIFGEAIAPDPDAPPGSNHPPGPAANRERALAVVALCVGGMVLSRAVDEAPLAGELRSAALRYAEALAGWASPQTAMHS